MIAEPDTFKSVDSWMQIILDKAKADVKIALIANKVDLEGKRYGSLTIDKSQ